MSSYRWVCHVCESPNDSQNKTCSVCSSPTSLSLGEIEKRKLLLDTLILQTEQASEKTPKSIVVEVLGVPVAMPDADAGGEVAAADKDFKAESQWLGHLPQLSGQEHEIEPQPETAGSNGEIAQPIRTIDSIMLSGSSSAGDFLALLMFSGFSLATGFFVWEDWNGHAPMVNIFVSMVAFVAAAACLVKAGFSLFNPRDSLAVIHFREQLVLDYESGKSRTFEYSHLDDLSWRGCAIGEKIYTFLSGDADSEVGERITRAVEVLAKEGLIAPSRFNGRLERPDKRDSFKYAWEIGMVCGILGLTVLMFGLKQAFDVLANLEDHLLLLLLVVPAAMAYLQIFPLKILRRLRKKLINDIA
jgi:hypothetical protein